MEIPKILNSSLFKGLVLNPSQIGIDPNSAQICSNVDKNDKGQLTPRKGTKFNFRKTLAVAYEVLFPFTYSYHDIDTGGTKEEMIALRMGMTNLFVQSAPTLYKISKSTVTVTYSGAGTGTLSILPEIETATTPNSYRLIVKTNGVEVLNETAPSANINNSGGLLSSYIADIDSLASWACSPASLPSSANLAYLDVVGHKEVSLTNGQTTTLDYYDITTIGTGENAPLLFTDANFISPSFQNFSNVLDIAYGKNLYKYDGRKFYRQGLPQGNIVSIADSAGGTSHPTGDVYIYKIVYAKKDARGNIIEGEDSDDTLALATHTMAATKDVNVTVTSVNTSNFGNFDARSAQVNGLQAGVNTITVDAGHTLETNDIAYLYDTSTSTHVERKITGTTATTITIAGATVSVADNSIISNNVKVQLWRTKTTGVDFYLVKEAPNDAANNTFVILDDVADASLTEPFVEQLRKHSLPPDSYFVGEHQGLRVVAGDPALPNRIRWSLFDDPEAFPIESNLTDLKVGGLGAITAFGTVDDTGLAVFKETGHAILDGTLDDLNFQALNRSNTGIGCTSHRTLAKIGDNDALTGLSLSGPFIFNNRVPQLAVSENILPLFGQKQNTQVNGTAITDRNGTAYSTTSLNVNFTRVLKRAMGFNDHLGKRYHLYLPAEVGTPQQGKYVDPISSKWLVFNYGATTPFWTEYTFYNRYRDTIDGLDQPNLNAAYGFTLYENNLWFGMQGYYLGTINGRLYSFKNDGTKYDYEEAAYPVYMDIHYTPFTRDEGSLSAFFKPLKLLLTRFIDNVLADPAVTNDFGDNFTLVVKGVINNKDYAGTNLAMNAQRTFDVQNGKSVAMMKVPTAKARSFQIIVSNENAVPEDYEIITYDQLEFIYTTPFDRQAKEPRQNG